MTRASGGAVRCTYRVKSVENDVVNWVSTYTSPAWDAPEVSRGALRFLDRGRLVGFVAESGLTIDEQFGDWDRSPLTDESPEIITIARTRQAGCHNPGARATWP